MAPEAPAATGIATDVIVFGRGLEPSSDGTTHVLNEASRARVEAVLAHVRRHREAFRATRATPTPGRIVFSGGFPGAAAGMAPPRHEEREGNLMLELARTRGVDGDALDRYVDAFAETASPSTLENAVRVLEEGYFAGRTFTPDRPLGLVAHAGHMDRCDYFTRKVFDLRRNDVHHILALGTDTLPGAFSEATLSHLTRLIYLGARTTRSLRRRERLLVTGARMLAR